MIELYQAMVRLSRQMLEAASRADWPLLIDLGQQRDAVETRLHALRDSAPDPVAGSEQEKGLVALLLTANQQIQSLVEAHLATMQAPADAAPPSR
jgi:hypothetical protein